MAEAEPAQRLRFRWRKQEVEVVVPGGATVADVKDELERRLTVPTPRQRITGWKPSAGRGKVDDGSRIADLKIGKLCLFGLPEAEQPGEPPAPPRFLEDEEDIAEDDCATALNEAAFNRKVERRVRDYPWEVLQAPRPGKKLVVFDVDYTLFDHKSPATNIAPLQRPFLHEMMAAIYPHYDIFVWSATSRRWVVLKLQQMGMLEHPGYRISCIMDSMAMVTVPTEKYGLINTKALSVIWGRFPEYGPHNTVLVDDLRRNFLSTPRNGIRIRPCRNLPLTRDTDTELRLLRDYLLSLREAESLQGEGHKRWYERVEDGEG